MMRGQISREWSAWVSASMVMEAPKAAPENLIEEFAMATKVTTKTAKVSTKKTAPRVAAKTTSSKAPAKTRAKAVSARPTTVTVAAVPALPVTIEAPKAVLTPEKRFELVRLQ